MTNPILGMINKTPVQNLLQRNPQIQQVMTLLRENGNDPQKAFYALAKQMGVDGDEIINMLK